MSPSVSTAGTPPCRWGFIAGPRRVGRQGRSLVWICEYPYRTIRSGPSDDCEGCRAAVAKLRSKRQAKGTAATPLPKTIVA